MEQRIRMLVEQHRQEIVRLGVEHGASNLRVFGSVAEGQEGADSDLDLLVTLEPTRSLFDRIALKQDLEDLLGVPVDVVTEQALHPLIRAEVLDAARPL